MQSQPFSWPKRDLSYVTDKSYEFVAKMWSEEFRKHALFEENLPSVFVDTVIYKRKDARN